ncbi:type VI secretion system lipoprotein TssJ, partial [Escherichia coli]
MNKWRNPGGWLCALALSFVCLLSGCSIDSDDVPDLMSQRLDLVIKASDKVN